MLNAISGAVTGLCPFVPARPAIVMAWAAVMNRAKRVKDAFRFHQTDDPNVVFIEERFVMDLTGGGRFENRVAMRVTFRDGPIADVVEYADRRALEPLLGRIAAAAG